MNPIIPTGEGKGSPLSFRVPKLLLKRIDAIASATKNSRSEAVLHLLRWACDAYEKSRAAEGEDAPDSRDSA